MNDHQFRDVPHLFERQCEKKTQPNISQNREKLQTKYQKHYIGWIADFRFEVIHKSLRSHKKHAFLSPLVKSELGKVKRKFEVTHEICSLWLGGLAGQFNRVAAGNATNFMTGINLLSYKGFSGSKEDHFPFRKPTVVLKQIYQTSVFRRLIEKCAYSSA